MKLAQRVCLDALPPRKDESVFQPAQFAAMVGGGGREQGRSLAPVHVQTPPYPEADPRATTPTPPPFCTAVANRHDRSFRHGTFRGVFRLSGTGWWKGRPRFRLQRRRQTARMEFASTLFWREEEWGLSHPHHRLISLSVDGKEAHSAPTLALSLCPCQVQPTQLT